MKLDITKDKRHNDMIDMFKPYIDRGDVLEANKEDKNTYGEGTEGNRIS